MVSTTTEVSEATVVVVVQSGTTTAQVGATSASSGSPTTVTSTGIYTYIGCYAGSGTSPTLSDLVPPPPASGFTVGLCAAACTGFVYFGMEYSNQCYCGNTIGPGTSEVTGTSPEINGCSMPCRGSSTEYCGGINRLDLYQRGPTTTASAAAADNGTTNKLSLGGTIGVVIGGCFLSALIIIILWLCWNHTVRKQAPFPMVPWNRFSRARGARHVRSRAMHYTSTLPVEGSFWDRSRRSFADSSDADGESRMSSTEFGSSIGEDSGSDRGFQGTLEATYARVGGSNPEDHESLPPLKVEKFVDIISPSFGAIFMRDMPPSPQSILKNPVPSILKRPGMTASAPTGLNPSGSPKFSAVGSSSNSTQIRSSFETENNSTETGERPSLDVIPRIRKEVRFGEAQIKEFGRTPFASTANSIVGQEEENEDKDELV
ncbi:hypothetical protein MMC13_002123 [Lambiella insularis]|nr:hypothetical protein [Lambiella insularis]